MRKQVQHRHEAYLRAQNVCAEHSPLLDDTPGGQKTRAALGTHLDAIDRLLALQEESIADGRAATRQCRHVRRTLRAAARAVVAVGRLVNIDTPVVGRMRLPGATTDDQLVAYSRELLDSVSMFGNALVAQGLPPDLPTRLGKGIEDFAAARKARAAARQRFTDASESIAETLDRARKTIDVLEAILADTAGEPSDALTRLRNARRVGPRVSPAEAAPPRAAPSDKAA